MTTVEVLTFVPAYGADGHGVEDFLDDADKGECGGGVVWRGFAVFKDLSDGHDPFFGEFIQGAQAEFEGLALEVDAQAFVWGVVVAVEV